MAQSSEFAKIGQEITFSAATNPVTVAAATALNLTPGSKSPTGHSAGGDQYIHVYASTSEASEAFELTFFLADDDSVGSKGVGKVFQEVCTVTGLNSTRQSHSTSAGNYLASVVFSVSGKNTMDLCRFGNPWPKWYVGCRTKSSSGTCTIWVVPGRAV